METSSQIWVKFKERLCKKVDDNLLTTGILCCIINSWQPIKNSLNLRWRVYSWIAGHYNLHNMWGCTCQLLPCTDQISLANECISQIKLIGIFLSFWFCRSFVLKTKFAQIRESTTIVTTGFTTITKTIK